MKKTPNNAFPTEQQFHMRELVNHLARDEMPLEQKDLIVLQDFVKIVRDEIVETVSQPAVMKTTLDGREVEVFPAVGGSIKRVNYYMLNERGLKLKFDWERGLLDKRLD